MIDYGVSGRFSRADMDAAIDVTRQEFLGWYGCELHRVSYASDALSGQEYQRYKTSYGALNGKTYVDGIVFTASFHTPPEDRADPASGFAPDAEYTGCRWVLLLTEDRQWDLVFWENE